MEKNVQLFKGKNVLSISKIKQELVWSGPVSRSFVEWTIFKAMNKNYSNKAAAAGKRVPHAKVAITT